MILYMIYRYTSTPTFIPDLLLLLFIIICQRIYSLQGKRSSKRRPPSAGERSEERHAGPERAIIEGGQRVGGREEEDEG